MIEDGPVSFLSSKVTFDSKAGSSFRSSGLQRDTFNSIKLSTNIKKPFFPKDFFQCDKVNNQSQSTKHKFSPTKPLLPASLHSPCREQGANRVIIDLQKEFDEDKELLDLLNNNTNSKKNERRKYVSIKESDIIPEVDEKTKTLSKLSKSKTSNFQEDEDEKPKTNIICQIDNKELHNQKGFSQSLKAVHIEKIIKVTKDNKTNMNLYSESPSTTEVTHDSVLIVKSKYSNKNTQRKITKSPYEYFTGLKPITTRNKTPPENHLILPRLSSKIGQSNLDENNQANKLSSIASNIQDIEYNYKQKSKSRTKLGSAPNKLLRINNSKMGNSNIRIINKKNNGYIDYKGLESIKLNKFYNLCLNNNNK